MSKEQQIGSSTDGWLFIQQQKKFKFPEQNYISFLLPAKNNTFVAGGKGGFELIHMDKDGNIIFRKQQKYPIKKALWLCPHVLIGWSKNHIVVFDLNSEKKVEMIYEQSPWLKFFSVSLISDVFVFEQKLFSYILRDPDNDSTEILYFNWQKVLKEETFTPVHTVQLNQSILENLVSKGDSKSKICWIPWIPWQDKIGSDFRTYEIQEQNKGLLNIFPLQKEILINFSFLDKFKTWQHSPKVFSIAIETRQYIKYFEYDIEDKKMKNKDLQLCTIKDKQLILKSFYHSQLLLNVLVTGPLHFASFRNKEDYSARVYFLEDTKKGFNLMHKFNFTQFKNHQCIEYTPNMFCLWHYDRLKNTVDLNLWNVVSMKDVYVFFMAEDGMDLDEDLIWDAIRLLSQNE